MAESSTTNQQQQPRLGRRSAAVGEVVEVQGGHIVRATGRKDRHSKVCTAKGPRDRRVRLAAHTAIQFYDVQDRLGYDRPSKAVDWLIKKAKSSIDELAQLPAWHPTATSAAAYQKQNELLISNLPGPSSKRAATMAEGEDEDEDDHRRNISHNPNTQQISSFLPPSMDSDAIADTIKSFFPVGASIESTSSAMHFSDLMSRSSSHAQDLRLSLHSLQDPIFNQSPAHPPRIHGQVLLSGTPIAFDAANWTDHHHQHQHQQQQQQQAAELSRLQRFADVTPAGYFFNAQQPPLLQQLLGHNSQFVSQRGPLQSSNTPSVRAWIDPPAAAVDHCHQQHQQPFYAPSVSGIGFASGYGGFPGFHIPARIQGDEEDHDGYSDKPSSASSDSRH